MATARAGGGACCGDAVAAAQRLTPWAWAVMIMVATALLLLVIADWMNVIVVPLALVRS